MPSAMQNMIGNTKGMVQVLLDCQLQTASELSYAGLSCSLNSQHNWRALYELKNGFYFHYE